MWRGRKGKWEGEGDSEDDMAVDKMSEKLNERCATADILLSIWKGWDVEPGPRDVSLALSFCGALPTSVQYESEV